MIRFIVAMDKQRTIGSGGVLPWYLPNDLKFFKKTTEGSAILMGRKTFLSIGRALPNRENIVVTSDRHFHAEGVNVYHDLDEALRVIDAKDGFVIGGAEVFKHALPCTDELYITVIEDTFAGDIFFPELAEKDWELVSEERGKQDEKNVHPHVFRVYKRINP